MNANFEVEASNKERGARMQSRSSFRLPPSAFRLGLSLTEVLISMGILTLGLLGVASVFPVGSFYMQKAEISDKASAIAQSVMSDIMARGMLNPQSWYVMVPNPTSTTANAPNFFFSGIDGKYAPTPPVTQPDPAANSKTTSTFTRPFAEALSEGLKRSTDPIVLAKQFGNAFVIDPMFIAAVADTTNNGNASGDVAYPFPASAYATYPWPSSYYYGTASWTPWRAANGNSGEETWPIRRVTFEQPNGWSLDKTMAESYFRGNDDLTFDFPPRDDRPAIQSWDISGSLPLARKWAGDYSWIVTVVPTTNAARDGMARNPEGFTYDVSVVVFHKRPLPSGPPATRADTMDVESNERTVGAKIISTSMNGGEILLTDMLDVKDLSVNPPKSISPFNQLRAGQWIMLCGPHPNSSTTEPRFMLNWYQVVSIEGRDAPLNPQGTTSPAPPSTDPDRRLVTVRGPQWPWQPRLGYQSAQQGSDVARLSDDLCVGIFRGAVAVHTKSIRLENPSATGSAALRLPGNNITPPSVN
jgi:Tfp pilus assembly protein PilV